MQSGNNIHLNDEKLKIYKQQIQPLYEALFTFLHKFKKLKEAQLEAKNIHNRGKLFKKVLLVRIILDADFKTYINKLKQHGLIANSVLKAFQVFNYSSYTDANFTRDFQEHVIDPVWNFNYNLLYPSLNNKNEHVDELSLATLPLEIAYQISENLKLPDIYKFAMLSKGVNTLFQPDRQAKVKYLLNAIEEADYRLVKKLLVSDITLIFDNISIKNSDDNTILISPLKFTCWQLNVNLLKFMYLVCQYNVEKHPTCCQKFSIQVHEQTEFINLDFFFSAYRKCDDLYNRWETRQITSKEFNQIWLNVGKAQRNAPKWMLKKLCSEDWNIWSKFTARCINCKAYSWDRNINIPVKDIIIDVLPLVPEVGLGFDYTLVHGAKRSHAYYVQPSIALGYEALFAAQVDVLTFQRLLTVNRRELKKLTNNLPSPGSNQDRNHFVIS